MKILDFLREEWVIPDLQGTDKLSVLKELSEVLALSSVILCSIALGIKKNTSSSP